MRLILALFALALLLPAAPLRACGYATAVLIAPAVVYAPAIAVAPAYVAPVAPAAVPVYTAPVVPAALPVVPAATIALVAGYTPSAQLAFFTSAYGYAVGGRLYSYHFGINGVSRGFIGGFRDGRRFERLAAARAIRRR